MSTRRRRVDRTKGRGCHVDEGDVLVEAIVTLEEKKNDAVIARFSITVC